MSEIQKQESFSDRIKGRIKDSIGELMTDEELKEIISKGVHEAFFVPRTKIDSWGRKEFSDSLAVEIVKECLREEVRTQVNNYLTEHKEDIKKVVADKLSTDAGTLLLSAITNNFQTALYDFQSAVQVKLNTM